MTISIFCAAVALAALHRVPEAGVSPQHLPHVLGGEPALSRLAGVGYDRSPTFRQLIGALQSRRGFIILAWNPALPRPLNGALADRVRVSPDGVAILWVGLRPSRADDRLLPLLAHELQHAVEALDSQTPHGGSLEAFFSQIAVSRHVSGYETAAALEVQARVRTELREWELPRPSDQRLRTGRASTSPGR